MKRYLDLDNAATAPRKRTAAQAAANPSEPPVSNHQQQQTESTVADNIQHMLVDDDDNHYAQMILQLCRTLGTLLWHQQVEQLDYEMSRAEQASLEIGCLLAALSGSHHQMALNQQQSQHLVESLQRVHAELAISKRKLLASAADPQMSLQIDSQLQEVDQALQHTLGPTWHLEATRTPKPLHNCHALSEPTLQLVQRCLLSDKLFFCQMAIWLKQKQHNHVAGTASESCMHGAFESFAPRAFLEFKHIVSHSKLVREPGEQRLFNLSTLVVVFTCTPHSIGYELPCSDMQFSDLVLKTSGDDKRWCAKDLVFWRDNICKHLSYNFSCIDTVTSHSPLLGY